MTLKLTSQHFDISTVEIKKLEINTDLKDAWIAFHNNSVASYRHLLLRFTNLNNEVKYLILNNAFMTNINDEVEIRYIGKIRVFVQNPKLKLQEQEKELAELKSKIKLLDAYYELNLNSLDLIKKYKLQDQLYDLQAITNFSLEEQDEL
ncbi:MSC_0621 family F1-like ATPase epsilon subunit [Mycoplasma hafezii]|uniref:MSC_0621 family F1-like ATPase epsilon subunit n=1 Tax=Mycoplasma hafezii TaxID=525886 RepID=UPI003CE733A3